MIVAKDRVDAVIKHPYERLADFPGSDLVGRPYSAPFPGAIDADGFDSAWTVLAADFVTAEDGTGVVHTAVMYGEDDFRLGSAAGLPMQHTVGEDGRFLDGVPGALAGMHVKEKDTERAWTSWSGTAHLVGSTARSSGCHCIPCASSAGPAGCSP